MRERQHKNRTAVTQQQTMHLPLYHALDSKSIASMMRHIHNFDAVQRCLPLACSSPPLLWHVAYLSITSADTVQPC